MSDKRAAMKARMGSNGPTASVDGFDKVIYGNLDRIDKATQNADPLPIKDIYPDPSQPRKIGPAKLRQQWELSLNITRFIEEWMGMTALGISELRNIVENYTPEDEEKDWQTGNAIADGLISLAQLAGNIRLLGLTYPITVSEKGNRYMVETGERRLWAFWLLKGLYGGSDYDLIPARIVQPSVWRQASENFNRENLNGVGMARQFALLLMDILSQSEDGPEFMTIEQMMQIGGTEQDFYAQVADGQQFKIPKGQGHKILNAMGLKHPDQLRRIRTILRLPPDIWMQADDENWAEGKIRDYLHPRSTESTPQNPHDLVDGVTIVTVSSTPQGQEEFNDGPPERSGELVLPGEKRAEAAGIYPMGDRPQYPSNRLSTRPTPLFEIGEWARVRASGASVKITDRTYIENGGWDYLTMGQKWFAEFHLEKIQQPNEKSIPTPDPSPLSGEGNQTPDIEEEDDPYDGRDWERPVKSTDPLFDKDTLMLIRDFTRLTKDEVWRWVTTHGYGLPDFMTWHSKVEEAVAEALALAEDTAIEFDTEHKTKKREVSE